MHLFSAGKLVFCTSVIFQSLFDFGIRIMKALWNGFGTPLSLPGLCWQSAGFPGTATLQLIKTGERKLLFLDDSSHGLY